MAELTDVQRKYKKPRIGLMRPNGPALHHPAAKLLLHMSEEGPSVGIDCEYPLKVLLEAIQRGAHPTAQQADAAAALRAETLEKVDQGFAKLIPWKELLKQLPAKLKLSPIAAIPHKSRAYRMILDLSFAFSVDGTTWPSVNEATDREAAPLKAMTQLGKVLPRIIYALATLPTTKGPVLMMKVDIKDGFWRIAVPKAEEYNFAYVLPQSPGEDPNDVMIVIPSALQMGWTSSPPFFCAATETARDVAQRLSAHRDLPPHPLEDNTIDHAELLSAKAHPTTWSDDEIPDRLANLGHLLEVFVDDFIGLVQSTDEALLRHHSRALLHAIHSIFPPTSVTGHDGEDPVSQKKLDEGEGIWAVRKEILGWIFDGMARTIELPPNKVARIEASLTSILRHKRCTNGDLQSLLGKLQHATLGIPAGKGLLAPLYKKITNAKNTQKRTVRIPYNTPEYRLLYDYRTLIKLVGTRPTHCAELVAGLPAYIGFCDACKHGVGGVWFAGSAYLEPIVWRLPWPQDLVQQLLSRDNPTGTLTINDFEMAGLLLQYLVLEQLVDLKHKHAAAWVDNTSTVSWATKLSSTKSKAGQRLVRALCLRHCVNESSPLAALSIAGVRNKMADLASRSFKQAGRDTYDLSDTNFLLKFQSDFPLTQDASWKLFRLADKLSSLVFSELRMQPSPMGSWMRLTTKGHAIGTIGPPSLTRITWTPISKGSLTSTKSSSSAPLLQESVQELSDEAIKSALQRFKSRYVPSARPLNWTENETPPTTNTPQPANTGPDSPNKSKGTVDKTPPPEPKSQSQSPSPTS